MNEKKKDSAPIIIGMILLFFVIVCVVYAVMVTSLTKISTRGFNLRTKLETGNVAFIEITGPILDSKEKVKNIDDFAKKSEIVAFLVYINSPGGSVGPTEEIYRALMRARKTGKKVYVSMGPICASGGYYIASAADKIVTLESGLSGSVGVLMQHINLKELYKFLKLDMTTFKSGELKDAGNPARDMTKKEKDYFQSIIDKTFEIFLNVVFESRKESMMKLNPEFDEKAVLNHIKKYADGSIWIGKDAFENGFADHIGDVKDTEILMEEDLGIKVKIAREPKKTKFQMIFESLESSVSFLKRGNPEQYQLMYIM